MDPMHQEDDNDEEEEGPPMPSFAAQEEAAQAMAEVAAMNDAAAGGPAGRRRNVEAEQAVLGATTQDGVVGGLEAVDESGEMVKQRFLQFLGSYAEPMDPEDAPLEESETQQSQQPQQQQRFLYPYAEQARQMARKQRARRSLQDNDDDDADHDGPQSSFANTLFLDFQHLLQDDFELAEAVQTDFGRFEPFLRQAVADFVGQLYPELNDSDNNDNNRGSTLYFCAVHNLPTLETLRSLRMDKIGRLTMVSGTVTRTSEVRPELLSAAFQCRKCGLPCAKIAQQYHYTRPTLCRNPGCKNQSAQQFVLDTAMSDFCDWQKVRLQEGSDQIPAGSMPRCVDVVLRNEMVEACKAGDRVTLTGSLVVIPDGSALARAGETPKSARRQPHRDAATGGGGGVRGLQATGVRELTYRTCFVATCVVPTDAAPQQQQQQQQLQQQQLQQQHQEASPEQVVMEFTKAQREEIRDMKDTPRLYDLLAESIAPTTFGHLEVKKGILLMLLGGVHKTTYEGIKLRGDLNVCIVGDPSTAKSQFLKYVCHFCPNRSVYTSGKASSAAGLTAAVQRDQDTGEYCIEAGALMLADNGICCIDEFDKMDPTDQVAIHEAMEQQTITMTKAGIHATLNARASILAAANPIHGRYDRTKTLRANVALSAPILSRFDLFFCVLDECHPDSDRQVAQHILNVHRCQEEALTAPFGLAQMQRYVRFCRTLNPVLTVASQRVMVDCYRKLRQGDTFVGRSTGGRSAYRITVRQLESMIRLSEALARLHCDTEIQPQYVREAARLLKTSIIQVETSDVDVEDDDDDDEDLAETGPQDDNDDDDDRPFPESEPRDSQPSQSESQTLRVLHPGEYSQSETQPPTQQPPPQGSTQQPQGAATTTTTTKKKRKTKISYEEYEAMANAISAHLRSLENDEDETKTRYLTWSQAVEWYLSQIEGDLGDSVELLQETRKKLNLVIRRLLQVDKVLVVVGQPPRNKRQEQQAQLAVHPNYVVSLN